MKRSNTVGELGRAAKEKDNKILGMHFRVGRRRICEAMRGCLWIPKDR